MGVQDQEVKFFLEGHANTRADKNKALILMRSTEWHIRRWSAENVATRRNTTAQLTSLKLVLKVRFSVVCLPYLTFLA